MTRELTPIDISNVPELVRIAEEVRASQQPRVLRCNSEDIAVLEPVKPARRRRTRRAITEADWEAFRSSAGGWADVDTDRLLALIYADRERGDRPPVEL